jgi:hypothetical protein
MWWQIHGITDNQEVEAGGLRGQGQHRQRPYLEYKYKKVRNMVQVAHLPSMYKVWI